ncbi:hypothetical protein CAPTEDRAFT_156565 [Capitella teleta]|uniref:tRNA (carboxymethyluridine(34)-5-O)-methyltransferase n=1 Tax=Capitella teleta TaxID=283909 RepID=R7U6G6_CAPTE|nr:hypothetical protein CAPTEDRAFT_156565 [Capitella teleta]|eukprot:ELU01726.1 hypothetical protein CAPTEDRAFT_156565 [Capitella teleta]
MTKAERRAFKKQMRSQHTLLRHENIISLLHQHLLIANGGLGNSVSRDMLEKVFKPCGSILDIVMVPGKPYSFVTFSDLSEAQSAVQSLQGTELPSSAASSEVPPVKLYLSFVKSVPGAEVASNILPAGLTLIQDFVSQEEEIELLKCIDWDYMDPQLKEDSKISLKHRRVKHFGFEFLYSTNNVDPDHPLDMGIPPECSPILQRMLSQQIILNLPDQLTVNQYQPGQGIPPHVDTHSAFEEELVSLSLGSQVVMDFKAPGGCHYPVFLPQRSLVVMRGESRYQLTHAIAPRKSDVVPLACLTKDNQMKLTLMARMERTSFTFRKVRNPPVCECDFPEQCDYQKLKKSNRPLTKPISTSPKELETEHVHQVYEEIATHFSDTRHTPWPRVAQFLNGLDPGSVVVDVGCGNGKYLGINPQLVMFGCDRSSGLTAISHERGHQVWVSDVLATPLRDGSVDAAICIAVIHHLSTQERRFQALVEMKRILRVGGKALIYVWARDQKRGNVASNYLKESSDLPRDEEIKSAVDAKDLKAELPTELSVHVNRTEFQQQDLLVPWKLKGKEEKQVFHRYYHVFEESELEELCQRMQDVEVNDVYYDQGNWCVIFTRIH